jgi:hypothetical protein
MKSTRAKLSLFIVGLIGTTPCFSQSPANPATYSCSAYNVNAEGTWRASRSVVETNGPATATRDTYEWQPTDVIQFADGGKFNWEIVYYWPTNIGPQVNIPETEIMIDMHFAFEARNGATLKKPQSSWLHFYRSADTGKKRHPLATSLSVMTLWHQYGSHRLSTRAILSLDDLLAFGTGHDSLRWEIRLPPDVSGVTNMVAKGHVPIAAMRGKAAEILKLRTLLDKKAANFRKQCQLAPLVPVSAPPSS